MVKFARYMGAQLITWLLLFNIHRLIFLSAFGRSGMAPVGEWLGAFAHSLPLDLSMAGYLLIVPFLLSFICLWVNDGGLKNRLLRVNRIYFLTCLAIVAMIQAGDMSVYTEWQTKLTFRAIEHLRHPMEPLLTASPAYLIAFIVTTIVEFLIGLWLYRKLIRRATIPAPRESKLLITGSGLLIIALLVLVIRGGWGQFPISIAKVYFSDEAVLNDAAVNSVWQFSFDALINLTGNKQLYHYFANDEADKTVKALYPKGSDSTISVLKVKRPNIVLLILESWSADCVGSIGEFKGLTPGFDSLAKNGVLFSNCYANSWMSEKGNVAILSGFPSLPTVSVADKSNFFRTIPSINQPLQKVGYQSSYFYGGYLFFANIRSYLLDHGFQTVFDRQDMKEPLPMGQLGVHDGDMLPYFLAQLNKQQQPFFSTLFTLSTHSPYDIPAKYQSGKQDVEQPYIDAIKYSDEALATFFAAAQKQSWYDSTLFILVADHSHSTPHFRETWEKDRFHIPFLLYGPALKDSCKGMNVTSLTSQMDIAATLLAQLHVEHKDFQYSRDIFSTGYIPFVPYTFHNGCAFIEGNEAGQWDINSRTVFSKKPDDRNLDKLVKDGQSFFQSVWNKLQQ